MKHVFQSNINNDKGTTTKKDKISIENSNFTQSDHYLCFGED